MKEDNLQPNPHEASPFEDAEYKQSIEALIESIIADLKDSYHSDLEPFEVYSNKVRYHLATNLKNFASRFYNGYKILNEELASHHKEKDKEL